MFAIPNNAIFVIILLVSAKISSVHIVNNIPILNKINPGIP